MAIHPLWNQYPEFQKELVLVKEKMDQSIKIRNKEITRTLQTFFEAGGKLLRPAYFLLFSGFGNNEKNDSLYYIAASLELLHVATLVHDDIIDESPLRRSLPSIQKQYGKDIAVYTGDFLFTVYFELISQSNTDLSTISRNAKSMKRILVGELDQMTLRYNTDITVKQYFQHIRGKTAQLFEFSCYEGARYGGASHTTQLRAKRIGYHTGMAFQIMDDILDYKATESELQKPVFEDMSNGYYTLPLILAMEKNREAFSPYLEKREALTDEDIQSIRTLIDTYKGIEEAEKIAHRFTCKALRGIEKLPNSKEKVILTEMTHALLTRQN